MTANPSMLGAVPYADEATFGDEAVVTFDERLPVITNVTSILPGLVQEKQDIARTVSYYNDGAHDIRMPQMGTFSLEGFLSGYGSTAAGALVATDVPIFLGRCVGATSAASVGGTVDIGSTTTVVKYDGGAEAFAAGSLCRVGTLGDAACDGQMFAVASLAAGDLTLLTNTAVAAAENDIIYAAELIHPNELSSTVESMRFNLQTSNQRYNTWGTVCTGVTFSDLGPGKLPRWSADMACALFAEESASTYPTTTAVDAFAPSPVAAGSFFWNNVGTATRQTLDVRDVTVSIDMQTTLLRGPGSGNTHQDIIGARRGKCQATITATIDREAAGSDVWAALWNTAEGSLNYHHIMFTMSTGDGTSVGFYFPRCKLSGPRPTQHDLDSLNAYTIQWTAITGATTTTELLRSNWRIGIA